jgi:replicative DNA helicase
LSLLRIAQNLLSVNNNLHVVTHPVTNVSNITALLAERKVDILCIDGVYLMSPSGKPSSDWKDLAEVSRSLKQIANSNSICVVGVIQGSRVNESGLTSAGVAGTDAFLQDADILFGVQKNSVSPGERLVDFECVKNRSGVPGAVTLTMSYPLFDVWENDGDSKIRS